jgi:hypothetical protein
MLYIKFVRLVKLSVLLFNLTGYSENNFNVCSVLTGGSPATCFRYSNFFNQLGKHQGRSSFTIG